MHDVMADYMMYCILSYEAYVLFPRQNWKVFQEWWESSLTVADWRASLQCTVKECPKWCLPTNQTGSCTLESQPGNIGFPPSDRVRLWERDINGNCIDRVKNGSLPHWLKSWTKWRMLLGCERVGKEIRVQMRVHHLSFFFFTLCYWGYRGKLKTCEKQWNEGSGHGTHTSALLLISVCV